MRGTAILLAFFLLFTLASLLIPSPMFPGNFFCTLIGDAVSQYIVYLSAIFNGIFYGTIMWLVFLIVSRKFEGEK
ncbi:MAG: hypothetical protein ACP5KU_03055 [Candidatus Bathyarchaeia archaeon]